MQTFTIDEATTQLAQLVDQAAKGDSFIIAKAGKPLVKVVAFNAPERVLFKRLGFMAGLIAVPDDFDRMGENEIKQIFGDGACSAIT